MIDNVCYFEHKLTTVCVTILKLDKLTNILRGFFPLIITILMIYCIILMKKITF